MTLLAKTARYTKIENSDERAGSKMSSTYDEFDVTTHAERSSSMRARMPVTPQLKEPTTMTKIAKFCTRAVADIDDIVVNERVGFQYEIFFFFGIRIGVSAVPRAAGGHCWITSAH